MVDIQPTSTQPISDDQELAKVLAGVSQQPDNPMQFEETPPSSIGAAPMVDPVQEPAAIVAPEPVMPEPTAPASYGAPALGDDLTPIKNEAINELRPLVDKLSLPPEEKFDTYLLLIRTTDDKSLVSPAHQTARQIEDESRRAMALLEIIKEIDYLSSKTK